ncbi:Hsp20/alpha crystallin family protein [Bacillus sp. FJAT-47783]|uniref:Hsp20/alpha crystallin family protein n=1 Tax=Bacillus sp. FJAT-47783 TaxID=2922712 RepID=UPI001FADAE08|nr:Hsp20/alpha crystallin family protein [Bacillus sp. FJAT-47783]
MVRKEDNSFERDEGQENKDQLQTYLEHLFQPSTLKPFFDQVEKMLHQAFPFPHISLDAYETENEYVIHGHLPDIKKEQIIINLFERYMTITIEHKEHVSQNNDVQKRYERMTTYGNLSKTFLLPYPVKETDLQASFHHGELKIVIPLKKKRIFIEDSESKSGY